MFEIWGFHGSENLVMYLNAWGHNPEDHCINSFLFVAVIPNT